MALERFLRSRLVVLSATTRLYDAVRAMEDNHVGAILVQDGDALVGVVTDRDLCLRVIGDDLDPFEFTVAEVMSSPVASVPMSADVAEVAALMLERHVRRIPVLSGSRIVGLVTLDDLILEQGVDDSTLAGIVRHQLAEPSRLKPSGAVAPGLSKSCRDERAQRRAVRHWAHQRRSYARLLRRVLAKTQLTLTDQAERALQIVLDGLLRRVTPEEAGDLLAQLPSRLREHAVGQVKAGPDLRIDRESLELELDRQLELGPERASQVLQQTVRALQTVVDVGEVRDLVAQLPRDLQELFRRGDEAQPGG